MPRRSGPPGIQLCRAAGCRQSKKSVNAAGAGGGERPLREWPWPRGLPLIQPGHPPAAPCAPGLRPGGAGRGRAVAAAARGGGAPPPACCRGGGSGLRQRPPHQRRSSQPAPLHLRPSAAARGWSAAPGPARPAPSPAAGPWGCLPSPGGFPRKGCDGRMARGDVSGGRYQLFFLLLFGFCWGTVNNLCLQRACSSLKIYPVQKVKR